MLDTALRRFFCRKQVSIYADFIDPFCYLGFFNLKRALPSGWSIDWRGFELNPATPFEGMELALSGTSDLNAGVWPSIKAYAGQSGLRIEEPRFVPNTRLAQVLAEGVSTDVKIPLIERIYQAYFSDRKNIGNESILIQLAGDFGFAREQALRIMNSSAIAGRLEAHRRQAMRHQFPGMPGFVLHGKTRFGALSAEAWTSMLGAT